MSSQVANAHELENQVKAVNIKVRDKPFIVICGCTGTGKTKLSIQLAEWLIKNNKKCEIINADAMQVYFKSYSIISWNQIIKKTYFIVVQKSWYYYKQSNERRNERN